MGLGEDVTFTREDFVDGSAITKRLRITITDGTKDTEFVLSGDQADLVAQWIDVVR
jgi:hypothetical protein